MKLIIIGLLLSTATFALNYEMPTFDMPKANPTKVVKNLKRDSSWKSDYKLKDETSVDSEKRLPSSSDKRIKYWDYKKVK